MCLHIIWLQSQRLPILRNGLVESARFRQVSSIAIMIGGRLWLKSHCRLVLDLGLLIAAESFQCIRVIVTIIPRLGIQPESLLKMLECFVHFGLCHENAG